VKWKRACNSLSFLDVTIKNKNNKLLFSTFRKLPATDVIINYYPCHPPEHKIPAANFLINRAQNYPISEEEKEKTIYNKTYSKQ
jgi:hypothetical protein